MNHQLIADLEAARALIDTPEKWHQGSLRDYTANGVAFRWCAVGACRQVTESFEIARYIAAKRALSHILGGTVWEWNDAPERTHAEVLELFDKAIANERSKA